MPRHPVTVSALLPLFALTALTTLTMAACSDETHSAGATSSSVPTSSTALDSTTSSSSSSSTSSLVTTTTHPAVVGLDLLSTGLGDALFGAAVDGVLSYVSSILGAATDDSGWHDPATFGLTCSGTQVRFVRWHDLSLMFTDESASGSGLRHFASYTYGPVEGAEIDPWGLVTEGGITVGSSVQELAAAYPDVTLNPADELSGPRFFIEDGLSGFLTGTAPTDQVISFVGGSGCGE